MKNIYYATDACDNEARRILVSLDSLRKSAIDPSSISVTILLPGRGIDDAGELFRDTIPVFMGKAGFGSHRFIGVGDLKGTCLEHLGNRRSLGKSGYPDSAYWRLLIPGINKSGRALYLDTDVVVLRDLGNVFDYDIGNAFVAGVVAIWSNMRNLKLVDKDKIGYEVRRVLGGFRLYDCGKWISSGIDLRIRRLVDNSDPSLKEDESLMQAALKEGECAYFPFNFFIDPLVFDWLRPEWTSAVKQLISSSTVKSEGLCPELAYYFDSYALHGDFTGDVKSGDFLRRDNRSNVPQLYERYLSALSFSGVNSNPDAIQWAKYFDAVYVVCESSKNDRFEHIMSEMRRIGVTSSGLLRVRRPTYSDRVCRTLLDHVQSEDKSRPLMTKTVSLTLSVMDIFGEALSENMSRVLVVEDDTCFLRDTGKIRSLLDSIPDSYDIVDFDWIPSGNDAMFTNLLDHGKYLRYSGPMFVGLTGVQALSAKAMSAHLKRWNGSYPFGRDLAHNDWKWMSTEGISRYLSLPQMAVQKPFSDYRYGNLLFKAYSKLGIKLSDYEISLPSSRPGVAIDWTSLFDGVYVTHYLPQDDRLEFLKSEFSRLGIPESMVHYRYAYPNRFSAMVTDKIKSEHGEGWNTVAGWTDAAMNNLALLHEARHRGSRRILLLENDVAFLKDLNFLRKALESIPADADLCQCEFFAIDDPVKRLECAGVGLSGNEYWDPGLYPQHGGACTILSSVGIDKFIEYWSKDPVPTDFAYRYLDCVKYHSRVRLAVQRPFESGAIAAANNFDNLSSYEKSLYRTESCTVSSNGKKCGMQGHAVSSDGVISLPKFPLDNQDIPAVISTLSKLMREHRDYREPSCLMARVLHESLHGSNVPIETMLLEQGLRVTAKKPGLPVDEWCWNGGPEKLLSELRSPLLSHGSEQYIVM